MLNRKQIFDAITDDGKIDVAGAEAQKIINRLMDLQSQNLQQADVSGSAICKPPLGLIPKYIHIENRLSDITEAILRYSTDRREIPMEWVQEYNELMRGIAI